MGFEESVRAYTVLRKLCIEAAWSLIRLQVQVCRKMR